MTTEGCCARLLLWPMLLPILDVGLSMGMPVAPAMLLLGLPKPALPMLDVGLGNARPVAAAILLLGLPKPASAPPKVDPTLEVGFTRTLPTLDVGFTRTFVLFCATGVHPTPGGYWPEESAMSLESGMGNICDGVPELQLCRLLAPDDGVAVLGLVAVSKNACLRVLPATGEFAI